MLVWKFYTCLREKFKHGYMAEGRLLFLGFCWLLLFLGGFVCLFVYLFGFLNIFQIGLEV